MATADNIYALIKLNEGWRPYCYDDATGAEIVPGYTVQGHPTIGWGFRLDMPEALTTQDCELILRMKVNRVLGEVGKFSWFTELEQEGGYVRAMAVIDLAYQVGAEGVDRGFPRMIFAITQRDWSSAADEIETIGDAARNLRRAWMMRTNEWPPEAMDG